MSSLFLLRLGLVLTDSLLGGLALLLSKQVVLWEGAFCSVRPVKTNLFAQAAEESHKLACRGGERQLHGKVAPRLAFPGGQSQVPVPGWVLYQAGCEINRP